MLIRNLSKARQQAARIAMLNVVDPERKMTPEQQKIVTDVLMDANLQELGPSIRESVNAVPDTSHNGYANYPTFLIGIHIDNREECYTQVMNTASEFAAEDDPHGFAEWLKEEMHLRTQRHVTSDNGLLRNDLINSALELVDWQELADHYLKLAAERGEK